MTHRTAPPERAPVVGPAPPPSPPGASGDHFAAILDKHQARTATAEGQDQNTARSAQLTERKDAARGREATPQGTASRTEADDGAKKAEGKEAPAAPVAVPVAVAPESTVDSRQSTVIESAAAPVAQAAAPVEAAAPEHAKTPVVPAALVHSPVAVEKAAPESAVAKAAAAQAAAKPAAVQGAPVAAAQTAAPADAEPVTPAVAQPQEAVEVTGAQPKPQVPGAEVAKPAQATADSRQPTAPAQPGQPATADTPKHDEGGHHAEPQPQAKPAAEPANPPTANRQPPTQPAQAPSQSAPTTSTSRPVPQQATAVRLPAAPQAVENTIRIAQARGVTHARLALRPAELGGVEIHLRSTADGLVARVTADGHQAAQVLQQAGDDLRRALQAQGIDLQRLDIGVAGDPGHGPGAGAAEEREAQSNGRHAAGSQDAGDDAGSPADAQAEDTIELPDGVLVDVLA